MISRLCGRLLCSSFNFTRPLEEADTRHRWNAYSKILRRCIRLTVYIPCPLQFDYCPPEDKDPEHAARQSRCSLITCSSALCRPWHSSHYPCTGYLFRLRRLQNTLTFADLLPFYHDALRHVFLSLQLLHDLIYQLHRKLLTPNLGNLRNLDFSLLAVSAVQKRTECRIKRALQS